jgi:MFS transporter, OFA family, oxalate/formate antiporter
VFYGWVVTWSAFTVLAITYGVQFSFGVFLPEIVEETGWSRTQLSLAISVYILVYGLLSGVTGVVTDRIGPRKVIFGGGLFLGVGYVLAAMSQQLWQFFVALSFVAAIGMSASFIPCAATVTRWFERDRGKALGLATSGGSFGGFLIPPIAGLLMGPLGWRGTYVVLAVSTTALLMLAAYLMLRDPSEKGLHPDGVARDGAATATRAEPEWGYTRREAMAMPEFWVTGAVFFFTWLAVFMPLVHLIPFTEDLGIGKAAASTMLSAVGIGGLVGRTLTGMISDRIGRIPSLTAVLAIQAVAFAIFATSSEFAVLVPTAAAFGFGYGGTTTMFPAIHSDQFGQAHIGAIVGAVFAVAGSAGAFGPAIAGYLYDLTDSYRLAFAIGGALNLVGLLFVGMLCLLHRRDTAPRPATAPAVFSVT